MTTSKKAAEVEVAEAEVKVIPEGPVELSDGTSVIVNRLKTRETMKLLKILTRGAGYALRELSLDPEEPDFAESLLLSMAFAIPEAAEETIEFVRVMVTPADLIQKPKSKPEKEVNAGLEDALDELLDNPEIEDLMAIVTRVIQVEAPHIEALGKRLGLLLKTSRPETN